MKNNPERKRESGGVTIEYLLVIAFLVLPLLAALPLMLDILYRHYVMITYVLLQPGP